MTRSMSNFQMDSRYENGKIFSSLEIPGLKVRFPFQIKIPVNGWIADTDNSTRRDWRWARVKTDQVDWPTNSKPVDLEAEPTFTNMESLIYSDIREIVGDEYDFSSEENERALKDSVNPYWRDMVQIQPIKWHNVRVETLNETTWMLNVPPSYNGCLLYTSPSPRDRG